MVSLPPDQSDGGGPQGSRRRRGTFETYAKANLNGADARILAGVQHPFVVDDADALAVNFIGRYESLAEDFAQVKARLAVDTLELDHFNQSYHAPWAQLYTRETFAIVGGLVAADAQLFGYPTAPEAYGVS